MATNIRKQLDPAKKRLKDRIERAPLLIEQADMGNLGELRTKLTANFKSLETLVEKLSGVVATSDAEQEAIESELGVYVVNNGCQ